MKIFLTGGTGLLGSLLAGEMSRFAEVIAAGHQAPGKDGEPAGRLNIEDRGAVDAALDGKGYTHVVHSAAIRVPEDCLRDPGRAYAVNAVAVEFIAAACRRNNAKLVYISTDYVFPGTTPPYNEDCRPLPVNIYGRTKLAGEYAARSVEPHLICRIPALWGRDPGDARSPLKAFLEKLRAGKPFPVESTLVRHYTSADDAARAVAFCVEKNFAGVVHISAAESQTKADFARAVARHYGYSPDLVINAGQPTSEDRRPRDTTMDTSLYRSRGGPHVRGLSEVFADTPKALS